VKREQTSSKLVKEIRNVGAPIAINSRIVGNPEVEKAGDEQEFQKKGFIVSGMLEHRMNLLRFINRPDGFHVLRPVARCEQTAFPMPFEELQNHD
jgi:hypothetical protein